ncbi:MAG: LamG domain-containing protein [Planctomycetia bacterium]|nr:LamG domain-containing protein [Planctomycetia bacterium]
MADDFDPYYKWLGIPPAEQPANHYRLLGVALFEPDQDVIEAAADRQMAHVQTYKTGKHSALSQKVLNELAAAKICLLAKAKKAAYDLALKARLAAAAPVPPAPPAPPPVMPASPPPAGATLSPAIPSAAPAAAAVARRAPKVRAAPEAADAASAAAVPEVAVKTKSSAVSLARRRRSSPMPWIVGGLAVAAVAVIIVVAASSGTNNSGNPATTNTALNNGGSQNTSGGTVVPAINNNSRTTGGTVILNPRTADDGPIEAPDPADERGTRVRPPRVVGNVPDSQMQPGIHLHAPLAEGRGQTTRVLVESEYREVKLADSASWQDGPSSTKGVKVYGAVCELADVGDFDKDQPFTCAAWVKLVPNDSHGAICSRIDDNEHAHRGWDFWMQQRRMGTHIVNSWPDNALKVLAKAQAPANQWTHVAVSYDGSGKAAGVKVYYHGEPQETEVETDTLSATTRTTVPFKVGQRNTSDPLWGAGVSDLRIYKRALSAAEIKSLAKNSDLADLAGNAPTTPTTPTQQVKKPVPGQAELAAARKTVRDLYNDDYKSAENAVNPRALAEKKFELSKKLFKEAGYTKDDPAALYALLDEAGRLSAEAGVPIAAVETVIAREAVFEMPGAMTMKVDALVTSGKNVVHRDGAQATIESARKLMKDAILLGDLEGANRLLTAARDMGLKYARDVAVAEFNKGLTAMAAALRVLKRLAEDARKAEAVLVGNPSDPDANLTVGKYYALGRDDWDKGLMHLSRCGDEKLRDLAKSDKAGPVDSMAKVAVADGWMQQAEQEKVGFLRRRFMARARYWYDEALPQASGLTKARIEKTLKEINDEVLQSGEIYLSSK